MRTSLIALAIALAAGISLATSERVEAQIERLDLEQLLARTDGALDGVVLARDVIRVRGRDGEPLFFTRLTVRGRSLANAAAGADRTLVLHYPGGVLPSGEGAWNSEAPAADDVALGNRVVVFHKWVEDLGGGLAGHALFASHGGLYRTVEGPTGPVVLGRGPGYALVANRRMSSLDEAVRGLSHR